MISHMDAQIGRVLTALEESGMADDTIVVFASDQGLAVGRHGLLGKQNLYEHSTRAPLMFKGPGIPSGARSDARSYLRDIYPPLCSLAGLSVPESVEGHSLAPILHGDRTEVRDTIFLAYRNVQRAVETGGWKLIRYPRINWTQLFHLEQDPHELHDLSGDPAQADRIRRMMMALRTAQERAGDGLPLETDDPQPAEFKPN